MIFLKNKSYRNLIYNKKKIANYYYRQFYPERFYDITYAKIFSNTI